MLISIKLPGFYFTVLLRLNSKYKFFPFRVLYELSSRKYGFQIRPNTKIGPGLYIGHFGSIIINENAILGSNINLSPGVVVGQFNRGRKKGVPVLNDKIWVGSNAIIVGGITIGDNVLIASGAYVNFDVPPNSMVIGNPGVIKSNLTATQNYINYTI